ncbi:hypothetical protein Hanom_Chr12g01160211 [Helianthus anomalus]
MMFQLLLLINLLFSWVFSSFPSHKSFFFFFCFKTKPLIFKKTQSQMKDSIFLNTHLIN